MIRQEEDSFSIIIPTYNRSNELDNCLMHLTKQIAKNFEVIVIDDNSTEDILAVVNKYENNLEIQYFKNLKSMNGPSRPRNIGISLARFEWIAFLDSDDWWYPNKLLKIREHFSHADVIYHDLHTYRQNKKISRTYSRQIKNPLTLDLLINLNALKTSSVVIRKSILNKSLRFDEDLITCEDFDLWLRVSEVTSRFVYEKEILGGYALSIDSITNSSKKTPQYLKKIYGRYLQEIKDPKIIQDLKSSLSYCIAVIHFSNKEYKKAMVGYKKAAQSENKMIKLKSVVRILQIYKLFLTES